MLKRMMRKKMMKLQLRKPKMKKLNSLRKREKMISWMPMSTYMMAFTTLQMAQDTSIAPLGKALLVELITTLQMVSKRAFSTMLMSNSMIQFTRNLVTSIILIAHIP